MRKASHLFVAGICAILAFGVVAPAAKADPLATPSFFNFDPTGSGNFTGPGSVQNVGSINFNPGNVLAVGGNTAVANFLNGGPAAGNSFTTVAHVQVGSLTGNTTYSPAAATTAMSTLLKFGETVTGATSVAGVGVATFGFNAAAPSSFQIFFDKTPGSGTAFYNSTGTANANDIGFTPGLQILTGHVIGTLTSTGGTLVTNTISTAFNNIISNFDQHLGAGGHTDNYAGQQTVTFVGSSSIVVQVDSYNHNYIQGVDAKGNPATVAFLTLPAFPDNDPFTTVDPSSNFGSEGFPNNGAGPNDVGGTGTNTLGLVNGQNIQPGGPGTPFVPSGPDIQFTTIGSASPLAVTQTTSTGVPEIDPSSIAGALTLLGGGLMYLTERRRRNKK